MPMIGNSQNKLLDELKVLLQNVPNQEKASVCAAFQMFSRTFSLVSRSVVNLVPNT